MCLFLWQIHTVFIAVALWYSLKSGNVVHLNLLLFLKIGLVILVFCASKQSIGFYFYFCEKCHWNFVRGYTESLDCICSSDFQLTGFLPLWLHLILTFFIHFQNLFYWNTVDLLLLFFSCWVTCDSFVTKWIVACQAPPFMGFSRQEYWSALPFPSPGDLSHPGIKPAFPALQADSLPRSPLGSQNKNKKISYCLGYSLHVWGLSNIKSQFGDQPSFFL